MNGKAPVLTNEKALMSKQQSITNATLVKKNKNAKGDKSKDDSKKQKPERAKKQAPKKEIVQILIAYKLYKPAVQGEEVKSDEQDQYARSVVTNPKTRVKNLKQIILEDLGLKETCSIRLYSDVGEPMIGDMDILKDLSIEKVQAELFYELSIQVENMGGQY